MTDNPLRKYSDEAKRIHDHVSLHLVADADSAMGRWMWFKLADGTSDGKLYDVRRECVLFARRATSDAHMVIQIQPGGLSLDHAERVLSGHRQMYQAGYRLPHPDDSAAEIALPQRMDEWTPSGLTLPTPRFTRERIIWEGGK